MWTQRGQDAARATGACENEMILVSENEYVTEVIFKDEAHTGGEGPFRVVEVIARRVVQ